MSDPVAFPPVTSTVKARRKKWGLDSPKNSKHYEAIGRALSMWNDLEFTVDRAIWRLVHKEQAVAACLTSQYSSMFSRMNAFICLVDLFKLSDDNCKKLCTLQGKMSSLAVQRNRIAHDPRFGRQWDNSVGRWEVVGKSKLSFGFQIETVDELTKFYNEAENLKKQFLAIWHGILTKIETFPELLSGRFRRIMMNDLEKLTPTNSRAKRRQPLPMPEGKTSGPPLASKPRVRGTKKTSPEKS